MALAAGVADPGAPFLFEGEVMSSKAALLLPLVALSAFAQYPAPVVSLVDGTSKPKDGYWALEPDPASDPSGQNRHGKLFASPPPRQLGILTFEGLPILPDWTSQTIDSIALFYFHDDTGSLDPSDVHRPRILYQDLPLDLILENDPPIWFADSAS